MPRKKTAAKKTARKKTTRKKAARKKRPAKPSLPKKTLDTIHKCWRETDTRKQCLERLGAELPSIPPPTAWGIIRKLSKTDRQWILTARQKERKKAAKKAERERKRAERAKKRQARERKQEWQARRDAIRAKLKARHLEKVRAQVDPEFFFCPDMRQQVSNISCIFRVFSGEDMCGFVHGGPCSSCKRMDKHIPAVEKVARRKK